MLTRKLRYPVQGDSLMEEGNYGRTGTIHSFSTWVSFDGERDIEKDTLLCKYREGEHGPYSEYGVGRMPAGRSALVKAYSLIPASPLCFDSFRALCVDHPGAQVVMRIANREDLLMGTLAHSWVDGEYKLKTRIRLTTPIVLGELVVFSPAIRFTDFRASSNLRFRMLLHGITALWN